MSAQPPPSNPNAFDELKQGVEESPPLDELKADAGAATQPPTNAPAIATAAATTSSAPSTSATGIAAATSPANVTSAAATSSADVTGAAATMPANVTGAAVPSTPRIQGKEPAASATPRIAAPVTPGSRGAGAPTDVSAMSVTVPTASDLTSAATASLTTESAIGATTPPARTPTTDSSATNLTPPTVNLPANGIVVVGGAISGTAQPNQVVVNYFNDIEFARVDADTNGKWQFSVPTNVAPGTYVVRVVVVGATGKSAVSAPQAIVVQVVNPLLPVTGGQCK